ncbi:MAG: tetratricopeptide repeat protein [bacterium]|nr:tetratricopeptide repeat protein [bacterium]
MPEQSPPVRARIRPLAISEDYAVPAVSHWLELSNGMLWFLSIERGVFAAAAFPLSGLRLKRRRRLDGKLLIGAALVPLIALLPPLFAVALLPHDVFESIPEASWWLYVKAVGLAALGFVLAFLYPRRSSLIETHDGRYRFEYLHSRSCSRELDAIDQCVEAAETRPDAESIEPSYFYYDYAALTTQRIGVLVGTVRPTFPIPNPLSILAPVGLLLMLFLIPPFNRLADWFRGAILPRNAGKHCCRGCDLMGAGRYADAARELEPEAKNEQPEEDALRLTVLAHLVSGQFDEAVAWCKRLQVVAPYGGGSDAQKLVQILSWQGEDAHINAAYEFGFTSRASTLTGEDGVAATVLRPSGKIRVQGVTVQAEAVTGYVPKGTPVTVTGHRGAIALCEPIEE